MNINFSKRKIDNEYLRIMKTHQSFDIEPSGNQKIDKAMLEEVKESEIAACKNNFKYEPKETLKPDPERQKLEEERRGAEIIGWYNRVFLGL